jgi:hypothetical protein
MANWNSSELQTPEPIKKIGRNAQNAINNLDILLKLVKQGADVAKLFLLLTNPAGAIIKLAANEIIKLCNDFKEIGVFYLFINPNDEGYGGQTNRQFGLVIKQDKNGLYQFEPSTYQLEAFPAFTTLVGTAYQKSLDIADLATDYKDTNGRNKNDLNFLPPTPILESPARWELGGYDPTIWTGHAPVYETIPIVGDGGESFGIFPPEMKPSQVLSIMSEAFDDRGDVSTFEVIQSKKDAARSASKIYTASGATIDKNLFDPNRLQTEPLFLDEVKGTEADGTPFARTLTQRNTITNRIQSGKPNFSGSSNIQGIEVIAVVALVGVESYKKFVDAFKSLNGLFGGMPSLSEFTDDIAGIYEKATAPAGTPMTIMNDMAWGTFEASTDSKESWIVGQKSYAKAKITKIVKSEKYELKKTISTEVKLADGKVQVFKNQIDDNEAGNFIKMDLLVQMHGTATFIPDEIIFEGVKTPTGPPPHNTPGKIIIKPAEGSALNPSIPYNQVNKDDVASYGKVLGIDTAAPDSIHPDWTSIKIKDVIPLYGDFFDEIIQFAEGLKGYAAAADEFIARIIKLIDDTIAEFEEIVNKIKAFLALFTKGLPDAGIYWLTIKTFGGNKAIQAALTGSDDPPPETLNFCAGFIMVSVSGVGGSSIEPLFKGLGLEFQEVAMIPETTELDTAVLQLQTEYEAAKAAQAELATDVFDVLGLNPPVLYRDATTIKFTSWNGVEPVIGDYVLGLKSGCFGQILSFSGEGSVLVLDHIKTGPTIAGTTVAEERIVRQLDVATGTYIEFPYDGSIPDASTLVFDANPVTTVPLVGEGVFTEEVLVNRSSHKPNGIGTTVYEVFQGNENTFIPVEDTEERIETLDQDWIMKPEQPFSTFRQDRKMKQQVFKVINGAVKDPELTGGFNGTYGHFTGDDIIISFGEELAQTFLADIEGRNAEDDRVTRLKAPPTIDSVYENKILLAVSGDDGITTTGTGGIVESYATAMDNKLNPENLPEE